MKITLCPSPDLFHIYKGDEKDMLVIIVDILRATTVVTTALANGAKSIIPVMTCQECEDLGRKMGYLMTAERNVAKCDFANLGNSPKEYTKDIVSGRDIVFTTTNGTRALSMAREQGVRDIIIGAFINVGAVAEYVIKKQYKEVLVVASGWNGMVSLEDCLFCGCLTNRLLSKGVECSLNDMATIMNDLYNTEVAKDYTLMSLLRKSEHFGRLEKHNLISDAEYCMQKDIYDFVVALSGDRLVRKDLL